MSKLKIALGLAAGLAINPAVNEFWSAPSLPSSDWKHDDARLNKAKEKRERKAAKRRAMTR